MPWREPASVLALGTAAQIFGVVLLVIGSILQVGQLAIGVPLSELEWLLFVIVTGFGVMLLLLGRALGRRYQVGSTLQNGYQATGEPFPRTDVNSSDGGAGDVGD